MPAIRKSLLQFVFSGSFMKRWNDKIRPMELVEIDKQAHKMITAWALFVLNSRDMSDDDRLALGDEIVEGGIFDYLYRLIITDIKPPVFYQIKNNRRDYQLLTKWVLRELEPRIAPLGEDFCQRMANYLMEPEETTLARRILAAAHLYASFSEFLLIESANHEDEALEEIRASFVDRLEDLAGAGVQGVHELLSRRDEPLGRFCAMCGHLRFQKRWSQTPRVPETSVLGHMFLVAAFSWFFSLELGTCRARRQNNFFSGLFHDLPELLTRDIISPVKRSAPEIADLIRRYESQELHRLILTPLSEGGYDLLVERLAYFLGLEVGSEFKATVIRPDGIHPVTTKELMTNCDLDELDPKDGRMLKMCDHLAAFIEAHTALKNGISSEHLHQAVFRIRSGYQTEPVVAGVHVGALLADFE